MRAITAATIGLIVGCVAGSAAFIAAQQDPPTDTPSEPGWGQTGNASDDCVGAQQWHLRQALDYSQQEDQDYHLKAAQAASQLTDCSGWAEAATTDA